MNLIPIIRSKLDEFKKKNPTFINLSDDFIFAFGPYMCMCTGHFEKECDMIAGYSSTMRFMLHAAYLIRALNNPSANRRLTIREFVKSVNDSFTDSNEKNTLLKYAEDYAKEITKKGHRSVESAMIAMSPIVPYSETVSVDIQTESPPSDVSIVGEIDQSLIGMTNHDTWLEALRKLFLSNFVPILVNYKCAEIFYVPQGNMLTTIDKSLLIDNCPIPVKTYWLLAMINYHNIEHSDFIKYLKNYKDTVSALSNDMSTESFSNFVELNVRELGSLDISVEALNDPTLLDTDRSAINCLLEAHKKFRERVSDYAPTYDYDKIMSFIALRRYMKFEEYPNRLFTGTIEKHDIVNVNDYGEDQYGFEMDNGTMVIPFLDLRDLKPKIIIVDGYTGEIKVSDSMHEDY